MSRKGKLNSRCRLQAAEAEWKAQEDSLESKRIEAELATLELTDEEQVEKDKLLGVGFATWTKRDFRAFVNACERHGRLAREAIFAEVAETTEKTVSLYLFNYTKF
jgi:SWI/SNF-related matrix-associated actin-dependent regulator of chromatin subfamily A member 5